MLRWFRAFLPREERFFDLFARHAKTVLQGAQALQDMLRGGDADQNARALLDVLKGKAGAFRDVALMNAAAGLVVAGRAKDLKQGFALAAKSIDSGAAEGRLDRLIAVSNG